MLFPTENVWEGKMIQMDLSNPNVGLRLGDEIFDQEGNFLGIIEGTALTVRMSSDSRYPDIHVQLNSKEKEST